MAMILLINRQVLLHVHVQIHDDIEQVVVLGVGFHVDVLDGVDLDAGGA